MTEDTDRTLPEIAWNARKAAQERRTRPRVPARYVYIDGHLYWLAAHAAEQMERCLAAALPETSPVTAPSEPEGYLEVIV